MDLESARRNLTRPWLVEHVFLLAAQASVVVREPSTWPGLIIVLVAAGVSFGAVRNTARSLGSGGDVLTATGLRVSSDAMRLQATAATAAAVAWLVVLAGDLVVSWPDSSIWVHGWLACGTLVELVFARARRVQSDLLAVYLDLTAGRDDAGWARLAALATETAAPTRDAVESLRASFLLRKGDGGGGVESLERRWSGDLDQHAAALAMARLARTGDVELGKRWLTAPRTPNPYERYLQSWLTAAIGLAEGRPTDATAALGDLPDVPAYYQKELQLLRHAVLRAQGEATPTLDPTEHWRERAQPWLWTRLTGRVPQAAAAPPARAVSNMFTAPADDLPPVVRKSAIVGLVPVPSLGVWRRSNSVRNRFRGVAGIALVVLTVPLLGLSALLSVVGDSPMELTRLTTVVGVLALAVGTVTAVPHWFVPRGARPVFALDDGLQIPVSWWWVFGGQGTTSVVAVLGLLFAYGWDAVVSPVALALAGLLGWGAWRRVRAWRMLRDAHHPEPARMLSWSRPSTGVAAAQVGALRAMAFLRAGDAAGAEAEARACAAHGRDAGFVLGWLAAGRGELELERSLALAEPEGLSARYHRAVRLCLGALALGEAPRLAGRLPEWDELARSIPNLYGDGLARLLVGVRRALGQPAGDVPPDTDWVGRVWAFVR